MADCAFTQEDLDRLDRAITQGVRSITFADGRVIQYSTFQEMVDRRNFIAQCLGLEAGRQRLLTRFKKGVQ